MENACLSEYFITIRPHHALAERITSLREYFSRQLSLDIFLPEPGVLICRFTQLDMVEERIIHNLQTVCSLTAPFHVAIDGFETRPAHSVLLQLKKNSLQKCIKAIKKNCQLLMKYDNDTKPWFAEDPNIVIASSLKPWQYEKATTLIAGKSFRDSFMAGSLCLLKKSGGITRKLSEIKLGEKINVNQQTLF